ncbi:MAG TPA: precorrin-2 C(20)-methyltransferase [Polyangia bacterium]
MTTTIYGVGVGPGAPDLLTLRAQTLLRSCPVLILPRSNDHAPSMAWTIARRVVGDVPGQERIFVTLPMSKDPARLRPAWAKAFARIDEKIAQGSSVAFLTEGDPSLFSSFVYLAREAPRRWPTVKVEIVPGVSSLAAVAAATGVPLADGQERIAIIPANYGTADLVEVLRAFDTVVLMKIGAELPNLRRALIETGLLDKAVYVTRASMPDERIVRDLRTLPAETPGDCFTMVVVAKKSASGVLMGDVPEIPRGAINSVPPVSPSEGA